MVSLSLLVGFVCTHSNDYIDEDAQSTFQIIGLAVPQEVPSHNYCKDEGDSIEDFEV